VFCGSLWVRVATLRLSATHGRGYSVGPAPDRKVSVEWTAAQGDVEHKW